MNTHERLQDLVSVAQKFGDGNLSVRIDAVADDDLGRLEEAFNQMAERLERNAERFNELDRLKSEFVSSVSHELRTPLTTIKALARLLMRGELSEEKRHEYLQTILVECDRQIDLVLNLLDLSRIEGGVFMLTFERVRVEDVITSCVRSESTAAEKRGHQLLATPVEAELPPVCADPKALRRVLSNLIENSIKYTPDGGLITISADRAGDLVTVSVTDNGRGIRPQDLPVLFDKFHRGKPTEAQSPVTDASDSDLLDDAEISGVGLGLYLAKNVMGRMGGRITVDTEVGRGSTFTLHLPIWTGAECGEPAIREGRDAETFAGGR